MLDRKPKTSQAALARAAMAYRQYAPSLHAYLSRRLHSRSDVPNLTMEIYERYLRTRQLEVIENPRAFLFRIASHVVADARRLESRQPLTFDSAVTDRAAESLELSTPDDNDRQIDATRELRQVRTAMRQLPPMHQAVLWLAVHDGLAHKEIARQTGLTPATVGLYVCEARARLRKMVDHHAD